MKIEKGLYLGKSDGYGWNNFIVQIAGESPFLSYIAWDRTTDRLVQGQNPEDDGIKLIDKIKE